MKHSPLTEFALLARVPDEALDLERLVVSVARIGNPGLHAAEVAATLDQLAERVADVVSPSGPPDRVTSQLARVLGGDLGFRGSDDAHGKPAGSYIDQVLSRRTGLPILLAIVWMRIGARIGIPISGIGFPGHFLARIEFAGAPIYIDPYAGGAEVSTEALLGRLPEGMPRSALDPTPIRPIVVRVLNNLKHLHVAQARPADALAILDRLLLVGGEVPTQVRDRGLLLLHLERRAEAVRDLSRYLTLEPKASDRAQIEALLTRR